MPSPDLPKPTFPLAVYQAIALTTLLIPLGVSVALMSLPASWIAGLIDIGPLLSSTCGFLAVLLPAVIAWAVCLLPLRQRTELKQKDRAFMQRIKQEGTRNVWQEEQEKWNARAASNEPKQRRIYRLGMGAVAMLFSALASLAVVLYFSETDELWISAAVYALASAGIGIYQFARAIR